MPRRGGPTRASAAATIFYGHGRGLFGRVDLVEQIGIVAAIRTLQLIASPIWFRHFRFGPFE